MKIDGHPFPTNVLETNNKEVEGKMKVLTSSHTKKTGIVDPKSQVSTDETGHRGQYEQGQSSTGSSRVVTSHMLLNKYQRQ